MQAQSIKSIRKLGVKETLDFKVGHPDHNFYAEGIVVSNSHSASYGYLTAITAYFKANYPKEFFLSLLKNAQNESDPLIEVNKIQKELKWFGIKLIPPSLKIGNLDFAIEGPNIRFGVNSIKGLAESALEKLNNFKPQNCSKFEMFQAAKQAGLSCGVMAALVMSGALDEFVTETRSKLSFECLLFSKLKDKEKLFCINQSKNSVSPPDLIELVKNINEWTDSLGKKISRKTRLNTLRKDTAKYQEIFKNNRENEALTSVIYEKLLLGFNYSFTLKQIFSKNRADIIDLNQFKNELETDKSAIVVCHVQESKTSVSKKGNPMMKLLVEDETDNRFFYFAGNAYQEFLSENDGKPNVLAGDIVALKLQKSKDGTMGFVQKLKKQGVKIFVKMADLKDSENSADSPEILPIISEEIAENPQSELKLS